ncbi:cytochrome P450 [Bdellovibrio reynosensis]|uniref:Cytochrome P450 n=1 Tax=Bdellovibrio reynosensis TaxID=2835041 RepID=A0ABY4CD84_9BACT|nr:cytochrome P450 [Bdellovibrio reynosensis]UOF02907.1 cytochrome P450 [Bdellovibrio reynosensis]
MLEGRQVNQNEDLSPDSTLSLIADPYRFISRQCLRLNSDLFETRLLMKKTICMTGKEAAVLFYDPTRFTRVGAAPEPLRATLFGKGGVQGLDGIEHSLRKEMFMSIMSEESIVKISNITSRWFKYYCRMWEKRRRVTLYDELQELLTRSVCEWAGVPLKEDEVKTRSRQLTALFDSAGSVGIRHVKSRMQRKKAESWIMNLVQDARMRAPSAINTPFQAIALHRDVKGDFLSVKTAAIEILNLLRPTVAISVFMVYEALALHMHPSIKKSVQHSGPDYNEAFVQEVRRFYPFFPSLLAKVKDNFVWKDVHFKKDTQVILDIYGTNHDPRIWQAPEEFIPERFLQRENDKFGFIPQGGGDLTGHRCPGEFITIALMKVALEFFALRMKYEVPPQNLDIDRKRMPAIPKSRLVIQHVFFDEM